jgi:hypothetical protein
MSRCLVIFHKQLGDLILLEPALRRLARANGHSVDLITRSGFQPLGSLMPHVSFRSKPNTKIYDALIQAQMPDTLWTHQRPLFAQGNGLFPGTCHRRSHRYSIFEIALPPS